LDGRVAWLVCGVTKGLERELGWVEGGGFVQYVAMGSFSRFGGTYGAYGALVVGETDEVDIKGTLDAW
jgi:hypothetical protein